MYAYESLLHRPILEKISDFERNGRPLHSIFAQQFGRTTVERICDTADRIRILARMEKPFSHVQRDTDSGNRPGTFLSGLLSNKRAMLFFTQASTRTFLSFQAACQLLGITCNEIRDPSLSSEVKGEHIMDSIRMFSTYFDTIIMRSKQPDLAERSAYLMNELESVRGANVPIINAGSGADEHPTQALLDIYTLRRIFRFQDSGSGADESQFLRLKEKCLQEKGFELTKGIEEKTIAFVGDIGRGRTVRSLSQLLSLYRGVKLHFVAPEHEVLQLQPDLRRFLQNQGIHVQEHSDVHEVLDIADAIYMTRIQREHDTADVSDFLANIPIDDFKRRFCMDMDKVRKMQEHAAILHPFPRYGWDAKHERIPAEVEIPFEVDKDPRARYFDQASNGMWVRSALISYHFNADSIIHDEFERLCPPEFQTYNRAVTG
ncbi:MAG: aspartate carbamoyltransferase [Planctomycetota bacterium]|jgi:aspartate carbamoyltransferase|nr:aspartate carbamoyltransferase [Planctomycetota bacterium]